MATMKDIARLAGVSTSTVSHVINQTRFVSDEIAARVNRAASELNYTPSALARSLKMNRTQTFGMLVTSSTNPFFAEVVKAVERRCYQQGYNLILCNTEGDDQRMQTSVKTLMERRVDGVILMCPALAGQPVEAFERFPDVPVVMMDWEAVQFNCDKIQDNSLSGGYLATKYLIEKGHRNIGCITGPLQRHQALMRYEGFRKAMQEAGLPVHPEWIVESDFESGGGAAAFATLKARGELPGSLFVCNDMMAMGLMHAAIRYGVKIPQELSVIGYDDIEIAQYMTPALTTVHQPKHRLGAAAVDALMQRLAKPSDDPRIVHLEPTLVIRDSVQPVIG